MPLPNPDTHEVIGEQINLAPSKVFFGINLVREKMKLPKLEYPKRKLAVSPEQLMAIETLYEPYLPLPPLGIHKIISKQLRMDEWRVHVAIGLVRKNRNLARWNEDREDLPPEMRESQRIAREEKEKADLEKAAERAEKEKEATLAKAAKAQEKAQAEAALAASAEDTEEMPAKVATKVRPTQAAQVDADNADSEEEADVDEATPVAAVKPKTTRTRKLAVATVEDGADSDEEDGEAPEAAPKPKARATRTVKEK
jgi:hypothetical protein